MLMLNLLLILRSTLIVWTELILENAEIQRIIFGLFTTNGGKESIKPVL